MLFPGSVPSLMEMPSLLKRPSWTFYPPTLSFISSTLVPLPFSPHSISIPLFLDLQPSTHIFPSISLYKILLLNGMGCFLFSSTYLVIGQNAWILLSIQPMCEWQIRRQCIKSFWAAKPAWEFRVTWTQHWVERWKGEIKKILMANVLRNLCKKSSADSERKMLKQPSPFHDSPCKVNPTAGLLSKAPSVFASLTDNDPRKLQTDSWGDSDPSLPGSLP